MVPRVCFYWIRIPSCKVHGTGTRKILKVSLWKRGGISPNHHLGCSMSHCDSFRVPTKYHMCTPAGRIYIIWCNSYVSCFTIDDMSFLNHLFGTKARILLVLAASDPDDQLNVLRSGSGCRLSRWKLRIPSWLKYILCRSWKLMCVELCRYFCPISMLQICIFISSMRVAWGSQHDNNMSLSGILSVHCTQWFGTALVSCSS